MFLSRLPAPVRYGAYKFAMQNPSLQPIFVPVSIFAPQGQLRRAGWDAIAWIHCVRRTLSLDGFVMLLRDPVRWLRLTQGFQRSDMLGATTGSHSSRGEKLGDGPVSWSASTISNLTESKNRLYGKWICGPGSV